jgi:flagellar assembly factor FliW
MKVATTRFGVIETDDSSVINLVQGPLGFEPQTRYCLIQHRPDTKFRWLQSVDDASLAFVVVDPSEFFTNYEFEVTDSDAERIGLTNSEDALALSIVTIAQGGEEVTANLAAPILINAKTLKGVQIVLQDNSYSVKHPLMEQAKSGTAKGRSLSKAA